MKRKILAFGGVVLSLLGAGLAAYGAEEAAKPLEIVSARWGAPGYDMDITEKVKGAVVQDCALAIVADNAYAGKDPARGKTKSLTVTYREFGAEKNIVVADHKPLQLVAIERTQELTVSKALYGGRDKWADVTAKIKKLVAAGGKLNINNGSMGGDPAYGIGKKLLVLYSVDNQAKLLAVPERKVFNASDLTADPESAQ
jgi:hypothetical protein